MNKIMNYTKSDIQPYITRVKKALRGASKFHDALSPLVLGLASAMWQLDRINSEMARIDNITYIEKTAYGEKIVPHPLFGMADKVQNNINRYCRSLGLRPEDIVIEEKDDHLTELTRDLIEVRGEGGTVMPDPE